MFLFLRCFFGFPFVGLLVSQEDLVFTCTTDATELQLKEAIETQCGIPWQVQRIVVDTNKTFGAATAKGKSDTGNSGVKTSEKQLNLQNDFETLAKYGITTNTTAMLVHTGHDQVHGPTR